MYILQVSQIWSNYWAVLSSPYIDFAGKWETFVGPIPTLFNFGSEDILNATLIIIISLLQGVVVATILFMKVFNKREIEMKSVCKVGGSEAASGIAAIISFFGIGCVPCKTVLISPVVSILFAGSGAAFATTVIMDGILAISVLLSVYSILRMLDQLKGIYSNN
jgi:hypothetical protein